MTGADLVLQPGLEVAGALAADMVSTAAVSIDDRETLVGTVFVSVLIFGNALAVHIHADHEDGRRFLDLGCHSLSLIRSLIAVAGAVGDGFSGLLVVEVAVSADLLVQIGPVIFGLAVKIGIGRGVHIGIPADIAGSDIGGGEAVAEEDNILVVDLGAVQHGLGHLQTGFHVGEALVGSAVVSLIDDLRGVVLHLLDQAVCLFRGGAVGHGEDLMAVGVEGYKAQLTVGRGAVGVGRKGVDKGLRRRDGRVITGGIGVAELFVHGIGDVHDQNHSNVLLLVDLVYPLGGGHIQGDVKVIFLVGGLDGLADRHTVTVAAAGRVGAAYLDDLNTVVRCRCLEGQHTCRQANCQKDRQYSLHFVYHVPFSFQISNCEIGINGGWAGIAFPP